MFSGTLNVLCGVIVKENTRNKTEYSYLVIAQKSLNFIINL